ncbi:MAG: FliM/FliN family flagellar motor switch protein [Burkholderiales bacterium]|nr:FliM/FliN family flagellar motor switch protein [Burkholderiales bacterium]
MATWRDAWGLGHLELNVICSRAWESDAAQQAIKWRHRFDSKGKSIWISYSSELSKFVQKEIFPPDQRHAVLSKGVPTIASEGAESCVKAFLESVVSGLCSSEGIVSYEGDPVFDETVFRYASGAALVEIQVGEQLVSCMLDPEYVQSIFSTMDIPRVPALSQGAILKSLAQVPVSLSVEVGRNEVEVASLMSLTCGDVIRLNTSVEKPLSVRGPDGRHLFDAYLGRINDSVAIEVSRKSL